MSRSCSVISGVISMFDDLVVDEVDAAVVVVVVDDAAAMIVAVTVAAAAAAADDDVVVRSVNLSKLSIDNDWFIFCCPP